MMAKRFVSYVNSFDARTSEKSKGVCTLFIYVIICYLFLTAKVKICILFYLQVSRSLVEVLIECFKLVL